MATSLTLRSFALWSLMVILLGAAFLLPEIEPTPSTSAVRPTSSQPRFLRVDYTYSGISTKRFSVPKPPPEPPAAVPPVQIVPSVCVCPDEPAPIIH